jgi:hypothetical protein
VEASNFSDNFRSWSCPQCYRRLHVRRAIDRNSWRKWYAKFSAESRFPYLKEVAGRIDALVARGPMYLPVSIDVNPGNCPGCVQPFEESGSEADRLECPQCHGRSTVLVGFDCHCSTFWDEYGFS